MTLTAAYTRHCEPFRNSDSANCAGQTTSVTRWLWIIRLGWLLWWRTNKMQHNSQQIFQLIWHCSSSSSWCHHVLRPAGGDYLVTQIIYCQSLPGRMFVDHRWLQNAATIFIKVSYKNLHLSRLHTCLIQAGTHLLLLGHLTHKWVHHWICDAVTLLMPSTIKQSIYKDTETTCKVGLSLQH